jgi:hypothetical protein
VEHARARDHGDVHLALVFFLQGKESQSLRLAATVLEDIEEGVPWRPVLAEHRALLVSQLARFPALPFPHERGPTSHHGEGASVRLECEVLVPDARRAARLMDGAVMAAERIIEEPVETPTSRRT